MNSKDNLEQEFQIRLLQKEDLPLCRQLVEFAGWNQTDADWLRALELEPEGCFVASWNGVDVATTTCCRFGRTGWIAMVLVNPEVRGNGIAGRLVSHSTDWLESRGVTTVCLDATAMGEGVYRKLGFDAIYEVVRYTGGLRKQELNDWPSFGGDSSSDLTMNTAFALDRQVFEVDRSDFLSKLQFPDPAKLRYRVGADGDVVAYAGFREGRNAVQIGPVVAQTDHDGRALLDAMASEFDQRTCFMDIPRTNSAAIEWAEQNGLVPQRAFVRMYRGFRPNHRRDWLWASSGPEKG
jgi:GNAT superfamily N-acetyltransferase